MIVAYLAYTIKTTVSGNLVIVVLGSILCAVALGLAIERIIMRPMLGEPLFSSVMVTVALALILRSCITFVWDAYPHALELGAGGSVVQLGSFSLRGAQWAALATLLGLLGATTLFFRYSKFGIAMRAVAADDRAAMLMGVAAARVHAAAWAASSVIAGIAGVFFAMIYDLSPSLYHLGLKSFPATILGGLDSVLGSGAGGLLIGVTENLAGGYLSPGMKDISGFLMIIVVLMVRPFGLFGEREIVRV
jgi:branched-chain amino acid transport system permease protein